MPERQPIEPTYRQKMNELARSIDEFFNGAAKGADRQVGFVLLVFEYGESEGRANYISNGANRKDMVAFMKEQIKHFENDA
jgi:hypothetical protein